MLFGPDSAQIRANMSKKTTNLLYKQEARRQHIQNGLTLEDKVISKEKEKFKVQKLKELALIGGKDYDFLEDYESSDYEFIDDAEYDHLNRYQQGNFQKIS